MKLSRFLFGVALVAALGTVGAVRPAGAAAAMPAALSTLVGSWSCTYTGAKGSSHSSYTITKISNLWVKASAKKAPTAIARLTRAFS